LIIIECGGNHGVTPSTRNNVSILIPRTCEGYFTYNKRDFAGGNKLRILRWGDYWVRGPNGLARVLVRERGRQEGQRRRWEEGLRGLTWLLALNDGRGHEPREAHSIYKVEEVRKWILY
jgi:hypothetical protein